MKSQLSQVARSLADALQPIDVGGIHRSTREHVLPKYPPGMHNYLSARYLETATTRSPGLPGWSREPWMKANQELQSLDQSLRRGRFYLAADAEERRLKSKRCANACLHLLRGQNRRTGYRAAAKFALEQGVQPPLVKPGHVSLDGCRRRLANPSWWRRKLKRVIYQQSEAVERELGLVQAKAGLYASDDAVLRRQQDKARSRAFLEECIAVNDQGESISLAEISDTNVSNPRIRRAELMTRLSGSEEYANRHGHAASFLTLTLPSRFHSHRHDGESNRKWDGSTPNDGQKWLCQAWARIRSRLCRLNVPYYGFRVAEPHHDSTPHWHMVLFHEPRHRELLKGVFEHYLLSENPNERGAKEHRFKLKPIDPTKGSATGYLAKYVSKNIDGYSVGDDLEDTEGMRDATDTVPRVETWASLWCIRQFQQIGGPSVSVWRELRRIDYEIEGRLETARKAADGGDWCEYMEAMGGHQTRFRDQPIKITRKWDDTEGLYGDPIGWVTIGIASEDFSVPTRAREWRIEHRPQGLASRTCVYNCTAAALYRMPYSLPRNGNWPSRPP